MNKLKKIIVTIIIVIIIIIIILISLLYILKNNDSKNNMEDVHIHASEINNTEGLKIQSVKERNQFYTIENCLRKYISYLSLDVEKQYDELNMPTLAAEYGITTEEEKKEAIYNLLDKQFIDDKNITINNLYDYVENIKANLDISVKKMNKLVDEIPDIESYSIYLQIKDLDNENSEKIEKYYIVKLDTNNETFSIVPIISNEYSDINEINVSNTIKEIEKNKQNTFIYFSLTEGEMATKYFQYYKNLMLNDREEAYNLLNEEYRNIRFGSYNEFNKYIENNIKEIRKSNLISYLLNSYSDYKEYVCKDQYNNIMIFEQKAIMDFTLKLDTYTIETEKFKTTYNESDNDERVQMNIDKFFQMINRQDYRTSYNCINIDYKNSNLKTEEEFEQFAKNMFFAYNEIKFKNITSEGNNLYVCSLEISDLTKQSKETKDVTIIMRLNEGTNFEMSFNI